MSILLIVVIAAAAAYWHWLRAASPPEPALSAPLATRTFMHDGRARRYELFVPASTRPGAPLVLVLHASAGDARAIRRQTGFAFELLAEQHGFVVAYPQGVGGYWNDCRRAGRSAAKRLGVDDVAFLRVVAAEVRQSQGVEPVFAAGFSNGGHMCFRLALEAPELVAAIAVFGANLPTADNSVCGEPRRFVPAIVVNGTADPINPYAGGHVSIFGWDDRGTVHPSEVTLAWLAAPLGAAATRTPPTVVVPRDAARTSVEREAIVGGGGAVALYTVHGGGHVVPQPRYRFPRILGHTERRFDAPGAAWELFDRVLRGRA